ncbi:MAG: CoA pyrophosphatase [Rhizobiaceae bacterium]|nr:CoA pyrophosphatase [Rhizobiaceae bacterium]
MSFRLSLSDAKSLLRGKLVFDEGEFDGDFLLNPDSKDEMLARDFKPAAVLIGLLERNGEAQVILTKRTEKLNNHSGQIAFPGGKIDADDASPEAAALREAWEEIGLDINEVEVMGRLPDYYSGSGFLIAPVVGIVSDSADFLINEDEVEYKFEVPLSFLMNPANHVMGSKFFAGKDRHYYEMPYEEHYIWGVTAGMIRVLHDRVFAHETA